MIDRRFVDHLLACLGQTKLEPSPVMGVLLAVDQTFAHRSIDRPAKGRSAAIGFFSDIVQSRGFEPRDRLEHRAARALRAVVLAAIVEPFDDRRHPARKPLG